MCDVIIKDVMLLIKHCVVIKPGSLILKFQNLEKMCNCPQASQLVQTSEEISYSAH